LYRQIDQKVNSFLSAPKEIVKVPYDDSVDFVAIIGRGDWGIANLD
jgi:hypothetical protein